MTRFLELSPEERKLLIGQTGIRTGMSEKAIEKDWWVTLVLKALFTLPMGSHFIFKGGTSLSKAWKIIERFSEDIDIALAPEAFGKQYIKNPTSSYVKSLKRKGCAYTSTIIKDALQAELIKIGVPENMIAVEAEEVRPDIPDKDPQSLFVNYASMYDPNPYIADRVKIEFSVRSLKEPFAPVQIQSIISETMPDSDYTEEPFTVTAVEPRKTFLEKVFLLHEKFQLIGDGPMIGERQSRHFSDLVKMAKTPIERAAFEDRAFYNVLLEHRKYYIGLKGIDYDKMQMSDLSFVPPENLIETFRKDYAEMLSEMIYQTGPPDFDSLIEQLIMLNERFKGQK